MKYIYKGMELELNDKIVKAYEAANEQKIDDSYIDYALENFPQKEKSSENVAYSIHNMICAEIHFIGLNFFEKFGLNVVEIEGHGGYSWKKL